VGELKVVVGRIVLIEGRNLVEVELRDVIMVMELMRNTVETLKLSVEVFAASLSSSRGV